MKKLLLVALMSTVVVGSANALPHHGVKPLGENDTLTEEYIVALAETVKAGFSIQDVPDPAQRVKDYVSCVATLQIFKDIPFYRANLVLLNFELGRELKEEVSHEYPEFSQLDVNSAAQAISYDLVEERVDQFRDLINDPRFFHFTGLYTEYCKNSI